MCDVETIVETDKKMKRKVPLGREDNVPETAKRIIIEILKHMSNKEKSYYDSETNFFEKLTSICHELNPKNPKPENKRIV